MKWQWAVVLSQAMVTMDIQRGAVGARITVPQAIYGRKVKEISRALPMRLYVFIVTGIFWVCFISDSFLSFFFFFWVMRGWGRGQAFISVGGLKKGNSNLSHCMMKAESHVSLCGLVSRNAPAFTFIAQQWLPGFLSLPPFTPLPPRNIYHSPI